MSSPTSFDHASVPLDALRNRAFNLRWATLPDDVIPLTAADMDFRCADVIREAMVEYSATGVFSYGPPEGLPEFREACAQMLRTRKSTPACAEHCLAVNSAAKGLAHVANAVLRPGDEALILDPVDFLFAQTIEHAGGVPVRVPVRSEDGSLDIEALRRAINARTRLIALCNPLNPVGTVFSREDLEAVGELALEHDIWILSDEIWSDIVFAPAVHTATASISSEVAARTFTVHGLSKTFGLSGLRIGFVHVGSDEAFARLRTASLVETTIEGVSTISQIAAVAAYTHGWSWVENYLEHLHAMRDLAVTRLRTVEDLDVRTPDGCSLLFPRVTQWGDETVLQERLLAEFRVAVVPGASRWFGPGGAGHLRISFATSEKILNEGLSRLVRGLRALR